MFFERNFQVKLGKCLYISFSWSKIKKNLFLYVQKRFWKGLGNGNYWNIFSWFSWFSCTGNWSFFLFSCRKFKHQEMCHSNLGACHSSKNFEISAKLRAFKIVKMGVFDVLKIYFNWLPNSIQKLLQFQTLCVFSAIFMWNNFVNNYNLQKLLILDTSM